MKLREAVAARREGMVLDGIVEIDGKYAGGHSRANRRLGRSNIVTFAIHPKKIGNGPSLVGLVTMAST
ncbi:hypothetical protein [Aliihoeflea sp. 2WW]|uniref:hypothetical protein n=1 Tax=Aliihoeflea sp. 2WW TaxID=1381123 RepID=UPI001268063A|nr:hypothetical protein [Aliihoeflea sp. 2WW]